MVKYYITLDLTHTHTYIYVYIYICVCVKSVDRSSTSEDINCSYFPLRRDSSVKTFLKLPFLRDSSLPCRVNQVHNITVYFIKINFYWNRSGRGWYTYSRWRHSWCRSLVELWPVRSLCRQCWLPARWLLPEPQPVSWFGDSFFFLLEKSNLWTVKITGCKSRHWFGIFL